MISLSIARRLFGIVGLGTLLAMGGLAQEACAQLGCINPKVKEHDDSDKRASHFLKLSELSAKQKGLLESLLHRQATQKIWDEFTVAHNDQAANFLAVTKSLQATELFVDASASITALAMVESLSEIRGVRLMAHVNLTSFEKWLAAGARYSIHLSGVGSGPVVESGEIRFAGHWQKGGGIHCGFDLQGYTHYDQPPYLHWNVNRSSGSSDIHLDGRAPWFLGFIPNPTHLQYDNSDVRAWLGNYEKKFGNPGFSIDVR